MTIYRAAIHTGKPIELYVPPRQWIREPEIVPQQLGREYNRYLVDIEAIDDNDALTKVTAKWETYCHNNFINYSPLTDKEKEDRIQTIISTINTGVTFHISELRCHKYTAPNGETKIICQHEVCPSPFDPSYEIWVPEQLFLKGIRTYIQSGEDWPTYKIIQQFGPFTGSTIIV